MPTNVSIAWDDENLVKALDDIKAAFMAIDPRAIEVARVLCEAAGFAPDNFVFSFKEPGTGAKGHTVFIVAPLPIKPAWALYLPEATALLEKYAVIAHEEIN